MREKVTYGINPSFDRLFRTLGQVAHVLRTRSPLSTGPKSCFSFDLHVLTMPPAFTLSQDQTLQKRVVQMHAQAWVIADSVFKKIWLVTRLHRSHKITFKERPPKMRERVPTNRKAVVSSSNFSFFFEKYSFHTFFFKNHRFLWLKTRGILFQTSFFPSSNCL